jgi:cytochrome c-type protein NrfB
MKNPINLERGVMKKYLSILVALCGVVIFSFNFGAEAEDQNKGAEKIQITAGSMAPVMLPHHLHQKVLKDCNLCHDLFPQTLGSINDLKSQQKLKKQQVMNTKCIQCHKAKKEAGEESGPVDCKQCHVRI